MEGRQMDSGARRRLAEIHTSQDLGIHGNGTLAFFVVLSGFIFCHISLCPKYYAKLDCGL